MASKAKEMRVNQREYWEGKLKERFSVLSEQGVAPEKMTKDVAVRKIRAKLRDTEARLKAIARLEKQTEEMARIKVEKAAAPKKEKAKKGMAAEGSSEPSKRQKKKMQKKERKDQ